MAIADDTSTQMQRGPETAQERAADTPPKAELLTGPQFPAVQDVQPTPLANNEQFQQSVNSFRGTFLGKNELGNEVWKDPTGRNYVLQQGENPFSDTRYYEKQGPRQVQMTQGYYMPGIEQQIAEHGGIDPWTNQPYVGSAGAGKPLSNADKMALAGKIQAWKDSKDATPYLGDLNLQRNVIDRFEQMKQDLALLNDEDIGAMAQSKLNWANMSAQDARKAGITNWGPGVQRALIDLKAQLEFLKTTGVPVLGRQEETRPGEPQIPQAILGGGLGWKGILGTLAGSLGLQEGSKILSDVLGKHENLTQLRITLPQALNELKKNYYTDVSGLVNQRVRIDSDMRGRANSYAKDLIKEGLGKETRPELSAPIAEPGISGVPGSAPLPTQGVRRGTPGFTPPRNPFAFPNPFTPRATPHMNPPPAPVAPAQRPISAVGNIPSYASQEELDAADHPPGTRFHWQPTNQEYVKV